MHRLNKAFIVQRNFTIMNPASPKLIGEIMIQVSSFICHILIMMQSQRNSSQRILGRTTTITSSTPLLKCLNDSLDNGQTEDNFSTSNQSRNLEVHTLFLTLNMLKVATIYLLSGTLGRKLGNLQPSPYQISTFVEISKQDM